MSYWYAHVLLHAVGFGLLCLAIFLMLRLLRKTPVSSYRLLIMAAVLTIVAPVVQLGLQGRWAQEDAIAPQSQSHTEFQANATLSHLLIPGEESVLLSQEERDKQEALSMARANELEANQTSRKVAPFQEKETKRDSRAFIASLLGTIYVLGLFFFLIRAFRKWARTRKVITSATPIEENHLLNLWKKVSKDSTVPHKVQLLESDSLHTPACWRGLHRSFVILPQEGEILERDDLLLCAFRHELVHLERRDSWVAQLQLILTSFLWFHPAAWWLASQIEQFCELSCDEETVRWAGRNRYAHALVDFASLIERLMNDKRAKAPLTLLSWSPSKTLLRRRIEMLISNKTQKSRGFRTVTMTLALTAIGFLWAGQAVAAAYWIPKEQGTQTPVAIQEEPPILGMTFGQSNAGALAAQLKLAPDRLLLVKKIVLDSRAHLAGLQEGDVLIGLAGKSGINTSELRRAVRNARGKDSLTLAVLHNLQKSEIRIDHSAPGLNADQKASIRNLTRHAIEAFLDNKLKRSSQFSLEALKIDPRNARIQRLIELTKAMAARDRRSETESITGRRWMEVYRNHLTNPPRDLTTNRRTAKILKTPSEATWTKAMMKSLYRIPHERPTDLTMYGRFDSVFENEILFRAIKKISMKSGKRIILSRSAKTVAQALSVTKTIKAQTAMSTLRAIMENSGLRATRISSSIIRIYTREELGQQEAILEFYDIKDLQAALGSKQKGRMTGLVKSNVFPSIWSNAAFSLSQKEHYLGSAQE